MTDPINSPDHVLVCGERLERTAVDHQCAHYGSAIGVVRVAYWPSHPSPWVVFFCVTRPNGVRVHYHWSAKSIIEAANTALFECTDDDVTVVLRSLRAMGETAHA